MKSVLMLGTMEMLMERLSPKPSRSWWWWWLRFPHDIGLEAIRSARSSTLVADVGQAYKGVPISRVNHGKWGRVKDEHEWQKRTRWTHSKITQYNLICSQWPKLLFDGITQ
jgi:hypothetical protein